MTLPFVKLGQARAALSSQATGGTVGVHDLIAARQVLTDDEIAGAPPSLTARPDDDGLIAMVDQQKQVMVNHNMTSHLNIQRTCQNLCVIVKCSMRRLYCAAPGQQQHFSMYKQRAKNSKRQKDKKSKKAISQSVKKTKSQKDEKFNKSKRHHHLYQFLNF